MIQPFVALMWDVDGVFVDTENLKFLAWMDLLREEGSGYTHEEYKLIAGQSFVNILGWLREHKRIHGNKKELKPRWIRYYNEHRDNGVPLITRNIDLLKDFDEKYPELSKVAVSSDAENIDTNLELAGIRNIFLTTISPKSRDGLKAKPAPDIYLLAIELLRTEADYCLAFEDTQTGVLAAKAAGIKCIALPNWFTEEQDFGSADHVFSPRSSPTVEEIMLLF